MSQGEENVRYGNVRYGIAVTYRCGNACRWCNRFLDQMPWPDSDVGLDDLEKAGKILHECGIGLNRVRLTGGEPLLHPQFADICRVVRSVWDPVRCIVVLTSHTKQLPKEKLPVRYSWRGFEKVKDHRPWMISPTDLGMTPRYGFARPCGAQVGCGRLFDAYGFSYCVHAGSLGRILRQDLYSGVPVATGVYEMCQHCVCSLSRRKQWEVQARAARGEVEYPTKTYRNGLEQFKANPFVFARFCTRCV